METILERIIADDQERVFPDIVVRDTAIREHKGNVAVVLGMRRTGKTFLCLQKIRELIRQGVARERILYVNFEDERLLPFTHQNFQQLLDVYFRMYPAVSTPE
jgi:uncharacterized protein